MAVPSVLLPLVLTPLLEQGARAFEAQRDLHLVFATTGTSDEGLRTARAESGGTCLPGPGGAGLSAALDDAQVPDTVRQRYRVTPTQTIGPANDDPRSLTVDPGHALAATLRTLHPAG